MVCTLKCLVTSVYGRPAWRIPTAGKLSVSFRSDGAHICLLVNTCTTVLDLMLLCLMTNTLNIWGTKE